MNNRKPSCSSKDLRLRVSGLLGLLALVLSTTIAVGQTPAGGNLNLDGGKYQIHSSGIAYTDYIIPLNGAPPYIQITARGADGGKAWIEALKGFKYQTVRTGQGGQGTTVSATFRIGTGSNELQPGSTLRTIIGLAGASGRNCRGCIGQHGGGGGGGTGLLYLPKGADATNPANWKILLVAGGGGGGAAGTGGHSWNGRPGQTAGHSYIDGNFWPHQYDHNGTTTTYGAEYLGYHGVNLSTIFGYHGYGGINTETVGGGGGTSFTTWAAAANGADWGSGLSYSTSTYTCGSPDRLMGESLNKFTGNRVGGNGLFQSVSGKILPVGGTGGSGALSGGYGFGGGGAGNKDTAAAGGGGGGYSGGWAGNNFIGSDPYRGGAGGGSYVSSAFAVGGTASKTMNGTTSSPIDGVIEYQATF